MDFAQNLLQTLTSLSIQIVETNFYIQQQRCIEIIRNGKSEEAIEFAQEKLRPFAEKDEAFLSEIERAMVILVTEGQPFCPSKDLFDESQWIKTSREVNQAVYMTQTGEKGIRLLLTTVLICVILSIHEDD